MNVIIGMFFSLCPPMLLVSVFSIWKTPRYWRKYLWMLVLMMMTLGYAYIPINNSDLVRYYVILDRFKGYSLSQSFHVYEDGMYIKNLLFWAISQTELYGVLPAVTVGTVYGVASYVTCSTAEKHDKEELIPVLLLLQFLLLPFYSIVNNVRNVMAFSFVVLAVYRDVELKKRNIATLILYIVPCFIHVAAVSLIILRFLVIVAKKHKYLVLALVFFLTNIIEILYRNISLFSFSNALRIGILRAYRYISDEYASSTWGTTVANSTWHRLNMLLNILLAISVLTVIVLNKRRRADDQNIGGNSDFDYYIYLISLMTVSFLAFNAPHYWRYGVAISAMIGSFIIRQDVNIVRIGKPISLAIWISAVGEFVLQCSRLMNVARSTTWLSDWLLSSPIRVLAELFMKLF